MDNTTLKFYKKTVCSIIRKNGYYNLIEIICSIVGVNKVETVVSYIKNAQYKAGTNEIVFKG